MPKVMRLFLLALIALLPAAAFAETGPGLNPGETLDKSSYQKAEGLLPPEILDHYKKGHYANPIVDWPLGVYQFAPEFLEASAANKGKFKVSDKGHVVDAVTGLQPPYIMGFPFPDLDAADPQAASKI
ncbi:MAG TPA: hypothetical protein VEB21_09185, partial [Terriglobales bacterium]|nr:hypothetical protein [Terriglobales bacterium]